MFVNCHSCGTQFDSNLPVCPGCGTSILLLKSCPVCSVMFHETKIREHLLRTHNLTPDDIIVCPKCDNLVLVDNFRDHFLQYHGRTNILLEDTVPSKRCRLCFVHFSFFVRLRKHFENAHESSKAFECPICKIRGVNDKHTFSGPGGYRDHFFCVEKHPDRRSREIPVRDPQRGSVGGSQHSQPPLPRSQSSAKNSKMKIICHLCKRKFSDNEKYNEHIESHHRCPKCKRIFKSNQGRDEHQLKCLGPNTCPDCYAVAFGSGEDLEKHRREIHGRNYGCPYCEYKARLEKDLPCHILHTHKDHAPLSQPCAATSSQEPSSFGFNGGYPRDEAQLASSVSHDGATHNSSSLYFSNRGSYAVAAGGLPNLQDPLPLMPSVRQQYDPNWGHLVEQLPPSECSSDPQASSLWRGQSLHVASVPSSCYAASFQEPHSMNSWAANTEESGRAVQSPRVSHGGAASRQLSASFHDESFSGPRYDPSWEEPSAAGDLQHLSQREYLRGPLRERREGAAAAGGLQHPQPPLPLQAAAARNRGLQSTEDSFLQEPSPKRVRADSSWQSATLSHGALENPSSSLSPHFCEATDGAEQPCPPIPKEYRGTFLPSDSEEEEY